MNDIVCIFPNDDTTAFLEELIKRLKKSLPQNVICYKIKPTIDAHEACFQKVSKRSPKNLILYLGHGQSDKLSGASAANTVSNNQEYALFRKKGFINQQNMAVFSDKKVICLSCNSNEKLGQYALSKNCQCFVGFGFIPTDWLDETPCKSTDVDLFRQLLCALMADAIIYAIKHQFNFDQFEKILKTMTNQAILAQSHANLAYGNTQNTWWVDESLYKLKDEVKIFGNRETLLLEM
jgi:hypothetical protein